MKTRERSLIESLFRLEPESRLLWQKYQLSITPKFYAALSILIAIANIRNFFDDKTIIAGVLLVPLLAATTAAGFYKQAWFFPLTRLTSYAIIPLMLWNYFGWYPDYPAPCLILLPLLVLFLTFADHLMMSTLWMLIALLLLFDTTLYLPAGSADPRELLLATCITTGMFYVSAMLLWYLLNRLFKSRAELSQGLEKSVEVRQSLLDVFFDQLSSPLDKLGRQVSRATISWPDLNHAAEAIKAILVTAREKTLELGARLDLDFSNSEHELAYLRDKVWRFLLHAGLISCLLIIGFGLSGVIQIRFPEIGCALILCWFLWFGKNRPMTDRIRLTTLYLITGLIAMACVTSLLEHRPPYQILYFYIIIFCAVFISGPRHSGITTVIAALFWCAWLVEFPQLGQAATYMRSNIFLGLLFIYAFSRIVLVWLRHSLTEISERDQQLHLEADTRHRLMATLFHDIANPLLVIQTSAEMAMQENKYVPDLQLMRGLAAKISKLVAFTREFGELEQTGRSLQVHKVVPADLFADLQATFSNMLNAKQLVLHFEKNSPPVLAHGEILGMSVLSNLLTNAIKFSPRGGTITISTERLPGELLKINVHDEGSGLPAEVIAQLQRGALVKSTTGTAGEYGDGQGLRLASLYLNKMNGKLVLDATAGISVVLPIAVPITSPR